MSAARRLPLRFPRLPRAAGAAGARQGRDAAPRPQALPRREPRALWPPSVGHRPTRARPRRRAQAREPADARRSPARQEQGPHEAAHHGQPGLARSIVKRSRTNRLVPTLSGHTSQNLKQVIPAPVALSNSSHRGCRADLASIIMRKSAK